MNSPEQKKKLLRPPPPVTFLVDSGAKAQKKIYGFEGIRKSAISALRNHCAPIILFVRKKGFCFPFIPSSKSRFRVPHPNPRPFGTRLKSHLAYIKSICKPPDQSHCLLPAKRLPQVKLCLAEPSLTPRLPFPAWALGPPPAGALCPLLGVEALGTVILLQY